jgi:hypothetical protein
MFVKFAANVLDDLSNELHLKAFCTKSEEDAEILRNLAKKVEWIQAQLKVEGSSQDLVREYGRHKYGKEE